MDADLELRLRDAFLRADSTVGRELRRLSSQTGSDHLVRLFDQPVALACKIRRSRYVADLLCVVDRHVLDFGSGCGFLAGVLAGCGAAAVTGVEASESRRAVASFLATEVFRAPQLRYLPSMDVLAHESVDTIILANVISHLREAPQMLGHMIRLLKPYGTVFVEDNNNNHSPLVRGRLRQRVWPGERQAGEIIYAGQRTGFIREHYPALSAAKVAALVDASYGLTFDELHRLIDYRSSHGVDPFALRFLRRRAPVDPDSGQYHENAFSPAEVECLLFNLGLVPVRVAPKSVFDFRPHPFVSWCFRRFPQLALNVAPAYEVLAVRK
jgi:SAM-dependent methyltransferase